MFVGVFPQARVKLRSSKNIVWFPDTVPPVLILISHKEALLIPVKSAIGMETFCQVVVAPPGRYAVSTRLFETTFAESQSCTCMFVLAPASDLIQNSIPAAEVASYTLPDAFQLAQFHPKAEYQPSVQTKFTCRLCVAE